VRGDVPVDNETLGDRLRESQDQFGSVFQRCLYGYDVYIFIRISARTYIIIYICTVFLKKSLQVQEED
jgi:hypothetical protein